MKNKLVTKNYKIATMLLAKFFSLLLKYLILIIENKSNQLIILPIIEKKIQNAIF